MGRLLNIEIANTASQFLAVGSKVNLGNIVRRYCQCNAFGYTNGGTELTLNQPGYYRVTFNATFTAPAAGDVTLQLTANGNAITHAVATESVATASTEVHTTTLSATLRVLPCQSVAVAIANTGVASTVSVSNLIVEKIV